MMQRIAGVLSAALLFVAGMAIFSATRSDPEPAADVEATAEITPATTSTTTTSTTTTTTTTTTLPPPRSARLAFTGDLLPHGSVQRAGTAFVAEGWDFAPLYDEVRPIIEGADLAICHLETPISIDDTNLSGYPLFSAPRAFAQAALDVGYDGCSLASNHSYDRGAQGALGLKLGDKVPRFGQHAAARARGLLLHGPRVGSAAHRVDAGGKRDGFIL